MVSTWVFVHGLVVAVERLNDLHGGASGDVARGLIRAYVNGLGSDWSGHAARGRNQEIGPSTRRTFFTKRRGAPACAPHPLVALAVDWPRRSPACPGLAGRRMRRLG